MRTLDVCFVKPTDIDIITDKTFLFINSTDKLISLIRVDYSTINYKCLRSVSNVSYTPSNCLFEKNILRLDLINLERCSNPNLGQGGVINFCYIKAFNRKLLLNYFLRYSQTLILSSSVVIRVLVDVHKQPWPTGSHRCPSRPRS